MQLYHHPYSLDSQKVRLALEEKGVDYTSHLVNPITGKNMDSFFFRLNPSANLPVFQNGARTIFDTIEIIKYIERIALVSSGGDSVALSSQEVMEWMNKIQEWNPNAYHRKLREAYETEEKLRNDEVLRHSEEHLVRLLDEVESKLGETSYLVGEEFTLADVMLIPVLARLMLLNLEESYINCRPNIAEYQNMVKQRPSYKKVIGRYFDGWRRRSTLMKTWCFLHIKSML